MALAVSQSLLFVLVGIILCFWGARLFKISLALMGFLAGAATASVLALTYAKPESLLPLVLAVIGGLVGVVVILIAVEVATFLVGAFLGVHIYISYFSMPGDSIYDYLVVAGVAIVGGIVMLILKKVSLVVLTSFAGAWFMVSGFASFLLPDFYFFDRSFLEFQLHRQDTPTLLILAGWLFFGFLGVIYQFRKHKK